jgi:hypothetical protein
VLKGLQDADRAIEYIDALISYVQNARLDEDVRKRLAVKFKQLAEALERI